MNTYKHPWDEWFALDTFTLKKGEHFTCTLRGMLQQVRTNASRRRVSIKTEVRDKEMTITVQVVHRGDVKTAHSL